MCFVVSVCVGDSIEHVSVLVDRRTTGDKTTFQLILAHVFTGDCKHYGGEWARTLQARNRIKRVISLIVVELDLYL